MKVNILVPTKNGGKFADDRLIHSSLSGMQESGPNSPEDEIITDIDEDKMSIEKIVASRFLKFLGDRRLTLESLKQLSKEEQDRIRKEFKG